MIPPGAAKKVEAASVGAAMRVEAASRAPRLETLRPETQPFHWMGRGPSLKPQLALVLSRESMAALGYRV